MKKTFELPKEFTEKWLTALRSGDYNQCNGALVDIEEDEETGDITSVNGYCCLGVACSISDISDEFMAGYDLIIDIVSIVPNKTEYSNIPDLLKTNNNEGTLVNILTQLNDGLSYINYYVIIREFPNLIFKKLPTTMDNNVRYSFNEIAEWIEDNIELV